MTTPLAEVRDYDGLVGALRARVDQLGCPYKSIEEAAGLADGHLGKIFGPSQVKTLGMVTVFKLADVLGLKFVIAEHLDVEATIDEMDEHYRPRGENLRRTGVVRRHISGDVKKLVMRELGSRGGIARLTKMSAADRSEVARRGGVARQAMKRPAKRLAKRRHKLGRN